MSGNHVIVESMDIMCVFLCTHYLPIYNQCLHKIMYGIFFGRS